MTMIIWPPSWFPWPKPNPVPPPVPPTPAPDTPPSVDYSELESHMIDLINGQRAKVKAPPLKNTKVLAIAASKHSLWMIATQTFSHTGINGSSPFQRMQEAGYTGRMMGENIAYASVRSPSGYTDEIELMFNNFMNSPGHKANMLNPEFQDVGIGFEVGMFHGMQCAFVTQDFGSGK